MARQQRMTADDSIGYDNGCQTIFLLAQLAARSLRGFPCVCAPVIFRTLRTCYALTWVHTS